MYVMCTISFISIQYYIIDNTHAKSESGKSHYLIEQHCIAICGLLVGCLATKIEHNVH